ncbi:MAG: chemotaxis protein CheA, partial [Nitrospinota bacterium]
RMVPVSGLFRRMIRLVHDLSNTCGKKVDFKLLGEETEVDKTVVEVITDPLVHIIRNSLDHGLESPEERAALKKPLTGTLKLSASHEEGQVRITVSDDGRGLNKEKILAKAKENGLIDDDGANMTNHQVFSLIFNPGFSTADRITDVSGRGVGMDVVKKNLDTVKGRVSVKSKPTKGTSISLRIPLTLAIIDGMVVKIKDLKYVIPVLSIKESFVPTLDAITETPDGSYVVRVRDNFYPVIRFDDLFEEHSEGTAKPLTEGVLVVLENQDSNVCLYVDQLIGQQQIVIKALSTYIDKVRGVSGCTILGDGEICLIVDVGSLVDSVEQKGIESQ